MDLYRSDRWNVIFVEWCQEFPGQCIISSNKQSLSELDSDDWVELGMLEKELERTTKKIFNATMYNFACLMNNAYRDREKPHVHFHFLPRYENERIILGKKYIDKHFGYNMWKWSLNRFKRQKDIFTKEEKIKMFEMLKEEFKI